jgi:hypothetical protein
MMPSPTSSPSGRGLPAVYDTVCSIPRATLRTAHRAGGAQPRAQGSV